MIAYIIAHFWFIALLAGGLPLLFFLLAFLDYLGERLGR